MKVKIPKPLNEGEERLALQLRIAGIPFTREHRFCERRWKFDFALPGTLAVEIEGGAWSGGRHTRSKGFIADMSKYNHAAALGWVVLRFTPQQVKSGQAISEITNHFQTKGEQT